jgi:hypothetical protein
MRSLPWGVLLAALSAPSCYDAGGASDPSDGGSGDGAGAGAECTNCGAQAGRAGATSAGGAFGTTTSGGSAGSAGDDSGAAGEGSGASGGNGGDAGASDGGEPPGASGGAGNEAGANSSGGLGNTGGTGGEAGASNTGGSTSGAGGSDTAGTGGTLAGTGGGDTGGTAGSSGAGTGGTAGTAGTSNGGAAGAIGTGEFLGYHEDDSEALSPLPNITLKVTNHGPAVPLNALRLRYYMEWEPPGTIWTGQGGYARLDDPYVGLYAHDAEVTSEALAVSKPGATHAMVVSIDRDGELVTGQSLTVLITLVPSAWDGIDKTNDYSYASHLTLVEWDRFTAHVGDRHVWGLLP